MSHLLPSSPPHRFTALLLAATLVAAGGCAGRPEAPILELPGSAATSPAKTRLDAMLPADVLLVGEQHDAAEHHRIEQQIIAELAGQGLLAALALEMAEVGLSTARLKPSSSEEQTRRALKWDDKGWSWAVYGPVVMTAVRAGVPVLGANLPREQMATSKDDRALDVRLPGPALKAQQQAIRIGHCEQLPETQITPMTRIQIARDITMAGAIHQAAFPGKVVVLIAGNGHVDRQLGVPRHLPTDLKARVIHLRAGPGEPTAPVDAPDSVWTTAALPDTDHCAALRKEYPSPP
ncbi:MAG: ChaN family lipoprotein [Polaromonas sp.]